MRHSRTWIETLSGKRFDVAKPNPKDVDINDIAAGLAKTARFNGQTRGMLSVAQHVVNSKELLEEWGEPLEVQLGGLTHDCSEAYIHDLASPLKEILPAYKRIEAQVQRAVLKGLGIDKILCLTREQWKTIKRADRVLLCTERRDFKANLNWNFYKSEAAMIGIEPWKRKLRRMSWWHAEAAFLETYRDLITKLK